MERPEALHATGKVENGKFTLKTLPDGAAQYVIPAGERSYIMLYTEPGQDLTVNINSTTLADYTVTGSKLMEDISRLDMESTKIEREFRELMANGNPDKAQVEKMNADYNKIFTDYITANQDAQAIPYAILHLEGQDFLSAYDAMTPRQKRVRLPLSSNPRKNMWSARLPPRNVRLNWPAVR